MSEHKTKYQAEMDEMPPGLDRAVLRVVELITVMNPIPRGELVARVQLLGWLASERQVRETIKQLRRRGYLICSTPGNDGGYYMANSLKEYEEFRKNEYAAKITDMAETMRAMDAAARERFGDGYQTGLGI